MRKKLLNIIFFLFVFLFDILIWILIRLLPSKLLMFLIRIRYKFFITLTLQEDLITSIKIKILSILHQKSKKKLYFSSCLSRSITISILLHIIGIKTNINIGIHRDVKGKFTPHAWVTNSENDVNFTSPLDSKYTAKLYVFR